MSMINIIKHNKLLKSLLQFNKKKTMNNMILKFLNYVISGNNLTNY